MIRDAIKRRLSRAALMVGLPVLVLTLAACGILPGDTQSVPLTDPTPTLIPPFRRSDADVQQNPLLAVYQLEERAALVGWTPAMHRQIGFAYLAVGNRAAAQSHWLLAGFTDVAALHQLVQLSLDIEQYGAAIDTLEKILTIEPDNARAHFLLASLVAASDPDRAALHLRVITGDSFYAVEAFDLLAQITRVEANDRLGMRVGLALMRHERWLAAEQAFRHTAAIAYPFADALAYESLAREYQGKDGQPQLDMALKLGPESPQVHYVAGLIRRSEGQLELSRQSFAMAAALDPTNPAFYAELAQANRLMFDYDGAEYWFNVAVTMSDHAPVFTELLAQFYAQDGDKLLEGDLESMQQAAANLPTDPDLLAGMGLALHQAGDSFGGLHLVETALSLVPEHPAALLNKARIYIDSGDVRNAIPMLRRLAVTDTEAGIEAQRLLATIEDSATETP